MEYLYKCEKCGKIYSTYDEASNCEDSHKMLDSFEWCSELEETAVYGEGSVIPDEIILKSRGDANEACFGMYKLAYIVSKETVTMLAAKHEARKEKDRKWLEKLEEEKRKKESEDERAACSNSSGTDDAVTGR